MNHNNASIDNVDNEKQRLDDTNASDDSIPDGKESPPAVILNTEQPPTDVAPATEPPPSPNGGYGWVCVACVACINAHTWGLNSSYGVFLAYYLANNVFPGATYLEFAFVGSLSIACALLVSPVATIFTRKFGTRTTLFTGVAFETASLIGASFASEIWQLFLSQGGFSVCRICGNCAAMVYHEEKSGKRHCYCRFWSGWVDIFTSHRSDDS
jgi:hypothetical protein